MAAERKPKPYTEKPKDSRLINSDGTHPGRGNESAQQEYVLRHFTEMFTFFELLTATC
jgi:hypothetical protein